MNPDIAKASKQKVRKILSAQRPQPSEGLLENLQSLVTELQPKTVASYQPLPSEPDISRFNDFAKSLGILLVFPRVVGENIEFAAGNLAPGAFKIASPDGPSVNLSQIELMLIPALGVDRKGNRLGKGRGFYDRVLGQVACPKYAIVYESEVLDSIPFETHDQKLNGAITPKAIHEFDLA